MLERSVGARLCRIRPKRLLLHVCDLALRYICLQYPLAQLCCGTGTSTGFLVSIRLFALTAQLTLSRDVAAVHRTRASYVS